MNQPSQLQAMTKKMFSAKAGISYRNVLHPRRDWVIGLVLGICVTSSIALWSGYMYVSNRDGGEASGEITIDSPNYQAALVDQALEVFTQRSNNFNLLTTAAIPVVAPTDVASTSDATTTATSTSSTVEDVSTNPEESASTDSAVSSPTPGTVEVIPVPSQ